MSGGRSRRKAVVTFALPDEGGAFVAMLGARRVGRGVLAPVTGELGEWDVTVAFSGVGSSADCKARIASALETAPDVLISSGFAGALDPALRVGDVILGINHSSPALAESARRALTDSGVSGGDLTTQPLLAETVKDKSTLAAATGAISVDMETGWIAEACAGAKVPLLSLRVISDAADQAFPVPGAILFDVTRQQPRYVRLPVWLLCHPGQIPAFVRFVRGLAPARERLAQALRSVLAAI